MVKWGIVGTGYIASTMAKDFKYVTNGKLVAVLGTSEEKAATFAQQHKINKHYDDINTFLNDDEIDAIYIATPHPTHKAIAIKAMKSQKAVLCEKPMAVNKAEELEMIVVAREEKVFLMEAFWTLFLPAIKEALKWLENGEIGKLRFIRGDFSFNTNQDATGRLLNPDFAGGALLDVGIYPIAMTNVIAKLVKAGPLISKHNIAQMTESNVDGQDAITLHYENGLTAQLTCGVTLQGFSELVLYGEKGQIEIPSFYNAKKAMLHKEGDRLDFKSNTAAIGYAYEVNEVNELLEANKLESEVVSLNHSLEVIEILDSLRELIQLKYPFE